MKICPTCHESNHDVADACMLCGAQLPALPEQVAPGTEQGPMLMPSAPPTPAAGSTALALYHDTEPRVLGYLVLRGDVCVLGREDAAAGLFPELDLSGVTTPGASITHASRRHATLLRGPQGRITLVAERRTTGTQVNRTLVADGERVELQIGDRIILGGRVRLKLVQF